MIKVDLDPKFQERFGALESDVDKVIYDLVLRYGQQNQQVPTEYDMLIESHVEGLPKSLYCVTVSSVHSDNITVLASEGAGRTVFLNPVTLNLSYKIKLVDYLMDLTGRIKQDKEAHDFLTEYVKQHGEHTTGSVVLSLVGGKDVNVKQVRYSKVFDELYFIPYENKPLNVRKALYTVIAIVSKDNVPNWNAIAEKVLKDRASLWEKLSKV